MFIKENINPKNKKTGDCVIRAIAKAEQKDWLEIFDALVIIARKIYSVPDYTDTFKKYLSKYPKIDVFHFDNNGDKKRYTVQEISKWNGTYLVSLAGHLTVTIDGNYYDIWDCGNKCAYMIWRVNQTRKRSDAFYALLL